MKADFWRFRHSLRARVALGVALPVFLAMSSLSLVHFLRERGLVQEQARLAAAQMGEAIIGSLQHAMLLNDRPMLAEVLANLGQVSAIRQVQILDLNRQVKFDSQPDEIGLTRQLPDPGCVECHRYPPEARPRSAMLSTGGGLLRIAAPIPNGPDCAACHTAQLAHLGILLADVPITSLEQHLIRDLQIDLATSFLITLLVTAGIYLLVHRLIVRRVEALRQPLAAYTGGEFTARLPTGEATLDELDELAAAFNRMAEELVRRAREEKERSELRQRAIVEERERIARELHDGMAQLLGYVNTKAMAARLLLKKRQTAAVDEHLSQLEQAARDLLVDVREAILGLKVTSGNNGGLAPMLEKYVAQFSQFSGVPVAVEIAPEVRQQPLDAECELQLLRIVQEALTNIRKHAQAGQAWLGLQMRRNGNGVLELTVADDGSGFQPDDVQAGGRPSFGLSTMRERAEAIGAEFDLHTSPGAGTRISVRLNVDEG